ncbi:2-nitropropane dioxygenase [Yamadazyma tenuis]|nr:2-nitropropane dioxygenase [Yamadazyma tenuis]
MAGVSTPKMAAAVAASGGLGSLAFGPFLSNSSKLDSEMSEFQALTQSTNTNINFFSHDINNNLTDHQVSNWYKLYDNDTAGIKLKNGGISFKQFEQQSSFRPFLDKLLLYKPSMVSFHFGLPSAATLEEFRQHKIPVFATATSVKEVQELLKSKVEGIVLQGYEAGGHRGNFIDFELDENLSTWSLFSKVKALNPDCFVVPAGGIVSSSDIKYYLDNGASGVQLGTAFVTAAESLNNSFIGNSSNPTIMTDLVSGRSARCLRTPFIEKLIKNSKGLELPPFQYGYHGYKQWRGTKGPEYGFYLVGQNYDLVQHELPVVEIMKNLTRQL